MNFFKIFKGTSLLFLSSFISCYSVQGMDLEETSKNPCQAIVPYQKSPLEKVREAYEQKALKFLRGEEDSSLEYRLLVAPILQEIKLAEYQTFLKSKGVILRSELDDRSVTKRDRLGKYEVMTTLVEKNSLFWCNGKNKTIEQRSLDDLNHILKSFPVDLPPDYKFSELEVLDQTHLILTIGQSVPGEKKGVQKEKIFRVDLETGHLKPFVDEDLSFVWSYDIYKKTPQKILVKFSGKEKLEASENPSRCKWVLYDLEKETRSVVGDFSKNPGEITFDDEDRPLFATLYQSHEEQTVSRITTTGPTWTVETIYSLGKEIYDKRRLQAVDKEGNIYLSVRGEGLDRWTPLKRTQKGPFASEAPLDLSETGDIKDFFVHQDEDGNHSVVYTLRDGGQKILKIQSESPIFQKIKEAVENLQTKYPGELGGVSCENFLKESPVLGLILAQRQSHRPLSYIINYFRPGEEEVTQRVFNPGASSFNVERLREVEPVMIPARDGFLMPAFITPSNPNMNFGNKPPLFVHIHGGPHAKDKLFEFDILSHFIASHGYAVLKVNYPGSTGSGLAYEKLSDGRWDETPGFILEAIDWMIKERGVDSERVAVGGVSFGATMSVNMAARFPERIKFAVACNGAYDYEKTVLEAVGYHEDQTVGRTTTPKYVKSCHEAEDTILQVGGDPRIPEQKKILNGKSVYPHLSKVECPILLLAGLEDNNCFPSQSIDLAKALVQVKKKVQLVTFEGRGHGLENVKLQKGESVGGYSFSAWNAAGAFTMKALNKVFGTPYEPAARNFSEALGQQGIKIELSHNWV